MSTASTEQQAAPPCGSENPHSAVQNYLPSYRVVGQEAIGGPLCRRGTSARSARLWARREPVNQPHNSLVGALAPQVRLPRFFRWATHIHPPRPSGQSAILWDESRALCKDTGRAIHRVGVVDPFPGFKILSSQIQAAGNVTRSAFFCRHRSRYETRLEAGPACLLVHPALSCVCGFVLKL